MKGLVQKAKGKRLQGSFSVGAPAHDRYRRATRVHGSDAVSDPQL